MHVVSPSYKGFDEGELDRRRDERYAGWEESSAQDILNGKVSLQQIHDDLVESGHEPQPVSGRQERLERLVARIGGTLGWSEARRERELAGILDQLTDIGQLEYIDVGVPETVCKLRSRS